jgi:hypothetical protein
VLATAQYYHSAIAVDSVSAYWTNATAGTVVRCAVGGCANAPTVLAAGQTGAWAIALDATSVYWVNNVAGGTVMRTPK